jgi:hypothetical protein
MNSDVLGGKLFLNRWELMKRMGFHAFRGFLKTWLRGERCQQDTNNFWTDHQPETMSERYSRMELETTHRLDEASRVRVGFRTEVHVTYGSTGAVNHLDFAPTL